MFLDRLTLSVLTSVLVLLTLLSSAASAAQKGVTTDLTWGLDTATKERVALAVTEAGAQWITVDMSWRSVETEKGVYNEAILSDTDKAISVAKATGARIVLTVNETPQWASGNADWRYAPTNPQDLADFYTFLTARYGADVDAWQVWNEPNHPHFWQPSPADNPDSCQTYGAMLKAAAPAIRAGDPSAVVLFAGLAFNDYAFVERCYELTPDIGASFDAMVTHPYAMGGAAPETVTDTGPADGRLDYQTFLAYREVRASMAAKGDPKPIWFTEFGWSTATDGHPLGNVSPATQADYVTRAYKLLEQDPYVEVAIWYCLRNVAYANDGPGWLDQLGLMRSDFTPKPSYQTFTDYTPPAPPKDSTISDLPPTNGDQPGQPGTSQADRSATSVVLRVRRRAGRSATRERIRLDGQVRGARGGRVALLVQRRTAKGAWKTQLRLKAGLSSTGRFARELHLPRGKRWRAWALYAGTAERAASSSRFVSFATRRGR